MTSNERILQPFTLPNGTELKNRLLMAPMTTCTGYFDGTVTSELVEYYRARAGSIGTIIVECCFIDDYGLAFPGAIGIDNDEKIAGLAKIAEAIKAEGSKAILQIYHGGRMVDPQLIGGRQPVAPSAIAAPRVGAAMPRALSGEEVEGMIAKFGEGVRRAILAGFDSNTLARNDDGSTGLVNIGFDVNFFGLTFSHLFVNNNGNVTFDQALSAFTPFGLTNTNRQIIAPFFADVDTRVAGDAVTAIRPQRVRGLGEA